MDAARVTAKTLILEPGADVGVFGMGVYDKTCIVVCHEEGGSPKQLEGALALKARIERKGGKHCPIVELPSDPRKTTMLQKIPTEIANCTNESRLYILGESKHPSGILSGMTSGHLAERLVDNYGLKAVAKIVLVACEAGGLPNDFSDWTYAKSFHHTLRTPFAIQTIVAAFNRPVFIVTDGYAKLLEGHFEESVRQPGIKFVEGFPAQMTGGWRGQRVESGKSDPVPAKWDDDSKIVWFWEGTAQKFGYWNHETKSLVVK